MEGIMEYFNMCDREGKGFLLKEDLQNLHEEIPLSSEQLEDVFSNLDYKNIGYITKEDFIEAFSIFCQHQNLFEQSTLSTNEIFLSSTNSSLDFVEMHNLLPESTENLQYMNELMCRYANESMKTCWKKLIENFQKDIANVQQQIQHLQTTNNILKQDQQKYLQSYEQMEAELEEEKNKAIAQERNRFLVIKEQLQQNLRLKEEQLIAMSDHQSEILARLNGLFKRKGSHKITKASLLKQQEMYIAEIESQKETISQLEEQFQSYKVGMIKECERRYREGYERGRKFTKIAEDGLLEELEMLKEINNTLTQGEKMETINLNKRQSLG